jgi:hypothetical protein
MKNIFISFLLLLSMEQRRQIWWNFVSMSLMSTGVNGRKKLNNKDYTALFWLRKAVRFEFGIRLVSHAGVRGASAFYNFV